MSTTPPRKSALAGKHYVSSVASAPPEAPATPEPIKVSRTRQSGPQGRSGPQQSAAPKPAKRPSPRPPAGTREFFSYWPNGIYAEAVSAYQVLRRLEPDTTPDSFVAWFSDRIEDLAGMNVRDRLEATRALPPLGRGNGAGRSGKHHVTARALDLMDEAIEHDYAELGVERTPSAFAVLATRVAAKRARTLHEDATGESDLPAPEPLPRGRRPDPPR